MKKIMTIGVFLLAAAPLSAQNWSIGVGTGAFVFGDFVERRQRGPGSPDQPSVVTTLTLSAETRAGLSVDLERSLSERWAVRVEGAFTRAPLSVKVEDDDDFSLDAGELDVTTLMVPVVFRINPRGSLRVHVLIGPAYAMYRTVGRSNATDIAVFSGSRTAWGGAAGAGLAWRWSDRFAVEGQIVDIVTTSPFERDDFSGLSGITFPKPHNVHTTVGVRYRF